MDANEAIFTRRSVRQFSGKAIEPDKLHQILEAAMSGPAASTRASGRSSS